MKFGKKHKVLINTMNTEEAQAFIKFLESEIIRHFCDIDDAYKMIKKVRNKFELWKT